MRVKMQCVKIHRFDGEVPKLGPGGEPIVKAVIEDGVAKKTFEMEPASCFTIELAAIPGQSQIWGVNPCIGKLELSRVRSPGEFVEGKVYSIEVQAA